MTSKDKVKFMSEILGADIPMNFQLRAFEKDILKDLERLEKLEKVIGILKRDFNINFLGENAFGFKPYEIMFRSYVKVFDKEEYELLKEVLEENG